MQPPNRPGWLFARGFGSLELEDQANSEESNPQSEHPGNIGLNDLVSLAPEPDEACARRNPNSRTHNDVVGFLCGRGIAHAARLPVGALPLPLKL